MPTPVIDHVLSLTVLWRQAIAPIETSIFMLAVTRPVHPSRWTWSGSVWAGVWRWARSLVVRRWRASAIRSSLVVAGISPVTVRAAALISATPWLRQDRRAHHAQRQQAHKRFGSFDFHGMPFLRCI